MKLHRQERDAPAPRVGIGRCPSIDHDLQFNLDTCGMCSGTGFIELREWDESDRESLRNRYAPHLVYAIARELRRPVSDVIREAARLALQDRGPEPAPAVVIQSPDNPLFGRHAR